MLTGLPRALDLAQQDLAAIAARLEVVHTEAYLPAAPDFDRPTPTRPAGFGPDDVAGPTWDCGLASYPARVAWQRMTEHLAAADAQTAEVLSLLTHRPPPVPVARERRLDGAVLASEVERVGTVRARIAARLKGLQRLHAGLAVNEPTARWLADALMGPRGRPAGTVCNHCELARHEAVGIVAIVGNGRKPPMCSVCKRVGTIGQPRKGGACDACFQRRYRLLARQRRAAVTAHRAAF